MITTTNGEQVTPLQNILGLKHNQLCKTQHGILVLVHNASKKTQLVFEPDVDNSTIQGCCVSVDKVGEALPMTLTISNYIPPIINL
jgi:hypothetical protein